MDIDGQKLWLHPDRIAAWEKDVCVPPIYVEISLTESCPHKCIFCAVDFAQHGNRLEYEAARRAIGEMATSGVRSIMFGGDGEPLAYGKNLGRLVCHAWAHGISTAITTNGFMALDRHILGDLDWVKFSVDAGDRETYKRVHGVETWEETIRHIDCAVGIKKTYGLRVTISAQFLVVQENIDSLPQFVKLFDSIGVDKIIIKPWSKHPRTLSGYDPGQQNMVLDTSIFNSDKVVVRLNAFGSYDMAPCRALPFWGYLRANGDFECCSVVEDDDRVVGNIYKESMVDIINGPKRITFIRKNIGRRNCRINCRMARCNEYLDRFVNEREHRNFV